MSYRVHITSTAEHDIMRAADYIEFILKNPD
ncbi:type II toxin-antitoxin system RelE/ParE family toxin, partial [Agathobacter rectalis]